MSTPSIDQGGIAMDLAEESGIELFSMRLSQTEANQLLFEGSDYVTLITRLVKTHDPRILVLRQKLEDNQDLRRRVPNDLLEALGFDIWYFMDIPFTLAEHRRWILGKERISDTLNRIVLSKRLTDPRRIYVKRAARESYTVRYFLTDEALINLFGTTYFSS